MKKVDRLAVAEQLLSLMAWMYDLRTKYHMTEAAMWDILLIAWYYDKYGKGISVHAIRIKRYGKLTGYRSLRIRLDLLIKKGLINQLKGQLIPSELLSKELNTLVGVKEVLDIINKMAA